MRRIGGGAHVDHRRELWLAGRKSAGWVAGTSAVSRSGRGAHGGSFSARWRHGQGEAAGRRGLVCPLRRLPAGAGRRTGASGISRRPRPLPWLDQDGFCSAPRCSCCCRGGMVMTVPCAVRHEAACRFCSRFGQSLSTMSPVLLSNVPRTAAPDGKFCPSSPGLVAGFALDDDDVAFGDRVGRCLPPEARESVLGQEWRRRVPVSEAAGSVTLPGRRPGPRLCSGKR